MLNVNDALTRDLITEILARKGAMVVDIEKHEHYTVEAGNDKIKLLILTMEDNYDVNQNSNKCDRRDQ